ncbi:MAG: alpha/beta fold hydrolase [Deltaproteobacteria bacterium]|nr:alpha/beta fold hydrolase [Deltaproteobacteria bacterium]
MSDLAAPVLAEGDQPPGPRPLAPQRLIKPSSSSWAAEYPFQSRWFQPVAGGPWLHYVDEGPRDAPVLFFLHGNPTWSFYWRKAIVALRDRYRCIAIDHLGMGLSDRPQADPYRLADHVSRAEGLIDALGIKTCSFIGHDWGGCIAAGVATRRPDRARSMTWMNTGAFRTQEIPLSIASCRIPVFGTVAVRGFNGFAAVATWRAMAKHERMTTTLKAGYLDPYSNWHDRVATLRFVEDIPLKPSHPSYDELAKIEAGLPTLKDKPITLFWGDDDFCFTPNFRKRFEKEFPAAQVHAWADCGHYVMEDAHERILPLLTAFFDKQALKAAA